MGEGWAVDVYERRGHGNSTKQPADYSMDTEIADVALLLEHTGAQNLFVHSLGGTLVLNAVRTVLDPTTKGDGWVPARLPVYDPAINLDVSLDPISQKGFSNDVEGGEPVERWHGATLHEALTHPGQGSRAHPCCAARKHLANQVRQAGPSLLPTGMGELRAAPEESQPASGFSILQKGTRLIAGSKGAKCHAASAQLHGSCMG